jgi:Tol biopolymer transport system component
MPFASTFTRIRNCCLSHPIRKMGVLIGSALLFFAAHSGCSCDSPTDSRGIKPLSENAFVFLRSDIGDKIKRLCVYDLKHQKVRSVTDFDGANVLSDISLSPDRRWVAFSALGFRLKKSDQRAAVINLHLWKVSVDGKHFVQLSQTSIPPDGNCPDFVNSYGPHEQTCYRQRGAPCFSPDGEQVYYSLFYSEDIIGTIRCNTDADCPGMSECYHRMRCAGIRTRGGSRLFRMPVRGGADEGLPLKSPCMFSSNPIFSHAGDRMLFTQSICSGSNQGVHVMKAPFDRQTSRRLVEDDVDGKTVVWRPDDSGFLYQSGQKIKEYNFAYKSTAMRFQYRRGTIQGFSPNADHSAMVIALQASDKKVASLYLMDMDTAKLKLLTRGHHDTWPCWMP